jgi:hypothetical protein
MRVRRRPFRLLAVLAIFAGLVPASAGEVKAVIELFTSQGCSSCPPADRLLGEFAADDRLLALSLPVDYWDYLGWRDTLALHVHSARQKAYEKLRGDRQVYTPQVVINGVAQTIGSDRNAIERATAGAEVKSRLTVPVLLKQSDTNIEVEVGAGAAAGTSASVWVLGITRATPVVITRGENRGKTITYHNVVRSWTRIGEWTGKPVRTSLPIAELAGKGADAAVVLIQEAGSVEAPGPICGAAMLALR